MCRSSSDPCGKRRCGENNEHRRARQRASTAANRTPPSWMPQDIGALPPVQTPDVPTIQDIESKIAHAEALIAEMDLNPWYPPKTRRGYAPAKYTRPGKSSPLRFDANQGWEVATPEGERLEKAIRDVGARIEARALMEHRQPSVLTSQRIVDVRRDLRERAERITGPREAKRPAPEHEGEHSHRSAGIDPARSTEDEAEALKSALDCVSAQEIRSQQEYEKILARAEILLPSIRDEEQDPPEGTPFGGVPYWERSAQCDLALREVQAERIRLCAGDARQSAWAMNEARLDSEARMSALREVREMGASSYRAGSVFRDPKGASGLDHGQAIRAVEFTAASLPRDWVDEVGRGGSCSPAGSRP